MSSPISSIPSTALNQLQGTNTGLTASGKDSTKQNQLDKDTFLKLLVAQLKYQDPSKPTDSSQFLAQTAQFTQVEKLSDVANSITQMVSAQQLAGASSLVGKTVSYQAPDGSKLGGVVSAVNLGGGTPTLRVGNSDIAMSDIKSVSETTAASAKPAGSPPPASTPPPTPTPPPVDPPAGDTGTIDPASSGTDAPPAPSRSSDPTKPGTETPPTP